MNPETAVENLRRKYGDILPPKYVADVRLGMVEPFSDMMLGNTEELAWIYFLILKKQEKGLLKYEETMLRTLIDDWLSKFSSGVKVWAATHGCLSDPEEIEEALYSLYDLGLDWVIEGWRDELCEEDEDMCWADDSVILHEVAKELASGESVPLCKEVVDALRKIEQVDPMREPLTELIILLDSAVDLQHQNGYMWEDYFLCDVVKAKESAEKKFEEVFG